MKNIKEVNLYIETFYRSVEQALINSVIKCMKRDIWNSLFTTWFNIFKYI